MKKLFSFVVVIGCCSCSFRNSSEGARSELRDAKQPGVALYEFPRLKTSSVHTITQSFIRTISADPFSIVVDNYTGFVLDGNMKNGPSVADPMVAAHDFIINFGSDLGLAAEEIPQLVYQSDGGGNVVNITASLPSPLNYAGYPVDLGLTYNHRITITFKNGHLDSFMNSTDKLPPFPKLIIEPAVTAQSNIILNDLFTRDLVDEHWTFPSSLGKVTQANITSVEKRLRAIEPTDGHQGFVVGLVWEFNLKVPNHTASWRADYSAVTGEFLMLKQLNN